MFAESREGLPVYLVSLPPLSLRPARWIWGCRSYRDGRAAHRSPSSPPASGASLCTKCKREGKLLTQQRPSGRLENSTLQVLVCHLLGDLAALSKASGFNVGGPSQRASVFQVCAVWESSLVPCCHLGMDIKSILQIRKPSFRAANNFPRLPCSLICTWTYLTPKPGSEPLQGVVLTRSIPETTVTCLGRHQVSCAAAP